MPIDTDGHHLVEGGLGEMEWHDACEDFACDFDKVEKKLGKYIAVHGAALHQMALDRLSSAFEQAASGKFEVKQDSVSTAGIEAAENILKELEEVEKQLREAVLAQSST